MKSLNLDEHNVGIWIKENCQRIDILLDIDLEVFTLSLVESVLQFKFQPIYEGHITQRNFKPSEPK